MSTESIFLKKVDRKAYRRLKSVAAERGVPVYQVLNEAISAYVKAQDLGRGRDLTSLEELDNAAFARLESEASLQERWVAIANGRLVTTGDTEQDVVARLREEYSRSRFKHGIVAKVGEAREEREWLAGSIQQV
ncbi:MAG: hypothetical protein JRN56_05225 [Nitrososphaerota archaeon]|jgi:predicted transcriptional regulator|nr:DUF5678 domain-containing protein [Nitrososphaerota archaeon]MDG6961875.1 hypothetical protein [Nitrososphaerota archaeon]MDG6971643.1 hypothetical protein [Nitrososphaerota archaeon]MDG6973111.1 hypothetical protein [Nitrososphaerota archaeon]MDG6985090.1 hypothetical protein [Nitrososphaerota archaeon]